MFVIAALDAQRPQISESSPRHDIDWSVRGLPSMQLFQRIVFQISFFQEHFFTNHHHLLKLTFAKVQSVPPPCPGLPLIDSHISPLSHIPVILHIFRRKGRCVRPQTECPLLEITLPQTECPLSIGVACINSSF